jgi:hypothetical protein
MSTTRKQNINTAPSRIPHTSPASAMAVHEVHELSCMIELMMWLNFIAASEPLSGLFSSRVFILLL